MISENKSEIVMAEEEEKIVLDISSDEDAGWGDSVGACCGGGGGGAWIRDDGNWISELLDSVDKETDDSDEVVVVGEVIVKPKLRVTKSLVKCANKIDDHDDDDDECVVLDGDPDKPVAIENENDKGEDDSDELLVVSEKGQVACRDYPHARHLCVNFPFSSTPHDKHCDQCHCYVCDSLAPCLHWSTGVSSVDHCHATDKDEFWKAQRKSSKKNDKAPPMAPEIPDTSLSTGLASPSTSDSLLQNQLLSAQASHELSSSNGSPNLITQGRSQQSGSFMRNKYEPHFVSQQLRSTYGHAITGDRRHNVGNAGTHFISRVPFKRTGTVGGVLPTNRYCNNSSQINHVQQFPSSNLPQARWRNPSGGVTPMMNMYQFSFRANVGGTATSLRPSLPGMTNMVNGIANYVPSQPPQTHGSSSVNTNAAGPQHQLSSQIYGDFNLTNPMPVQPGLSTQQNWNCPINYSFPFELQATSYPNDARISRDPMSSEPLVTSFSNMSNCFVSAAPTQPNADCGFENPSLLRPQVCGQPVPLSNHGAETFQQGNQTQSSLHPQSAECGDSSDSPTSNSKQTLGLECKQLENAALRDEPAVNVNGLSTVLGSTNSYPFDIQLDSWTFEDQSTLGSLEIPVPPELNVFSPEAVPLDAGLFDF